MRYFTLLLFSIALAVHPAAGQDISIHGVSLGDRFSAAMDTLQDRGAVDLRTEATDLFYFIRCRIDSRIVTVSSIKEEGETLKRADVHEIASSLSVVDASSQEVVETYNYYKKRWSEQIGRISPKERGATYYWNWETDDLEANITYMEQGMNPHSIDLTISRP